MKKTYILLFKIFIITSILLVIYSQIQYRRNRADWDRLINLIIIDNLPKTGGLSVTSTSGIEIEKPNVFKIEATATKADIVGMIAKKSVEHGISPILALQIAFKESSFNPKAHNPSSSAKGLYEFTDGTWKNYCKGDVYNAEDNLNCFLTNYPTHKSWWR